MAPGRNRSGTGFDPGLCQKFADHPKKGIVTAADSACQQFHRRRVGLQLRQRGTIDLADHDDAVTTGLLDQITRLPDGAQWCIENFEC